MKRFNHPCKAILIMMLSLIIYHAHAQIEGMWLVKKVMVADRVMTPVAKWVQLKPDGTQTSGNGLLQHIKGSWHLDSKKSTLTLKTEIGPMDTYGPFQINYKKNVMTWQRTEDDEKVVVELERTESLPESPADRIVGLWDVKQIINNEVDVTSEVDANNKEYIFMRWDRVFVKRTAHGERQMGIWHVNAHKPILELINNDSNIAKVQWEIFFADSKMIWVGLSKTNKQLKITFQRLDQFPE